MVVLKTKVTNYRAVNPTENTFVAVCNLCEGGHNYHLIHLADYKAGKLGFYGINWITAVIDFFAAIGWAYNLKNVSLKPTKNSDGAHPYSIQQKQVHQEATAVENVTASCEEIHSDEELQQVLKFFASYL